MKNREVIERAMVLESLDLTGLRGAKLSYAIVKNSETLNKERAIIEESTKMPEDVQEFEKKLRTTFEEYAIKDEKGDLVVDKDNKINIDPSNSKKYNAKILKMKKVAAKIVAKAEKIEKEFKKFIEDDCLSETVLITISVDDMPDETTPMQMDSLKFMITEFTE